MIDAKTLAECIKNETAVLYNGRRYIPYQYLYTNRNGEIIKSVALRDKNEKSVFTVDIGEVEYEEDGV